MDILYYFNKNKLEGITTVAGRPWCHKNWLVINMVKWLCDNKKVLYITLNNEVKDIKVRLNVLDRLLPYELVKRVEEEYDLCANLFDIDNELIDIVDNIKDLDSLDKYLNKNKVDVIVIDYIQLFNLNDEYLELKKLVDRYNLSFILISQLGRDVDSHDGLARPLDIKAPLLSITDQLVLLSSQDKYILVDIYKDDKKIESIKQEFINNRNCFVDYTEEDRLYKHKDLKHQIDYLKNYTTKLNHISNLDDISELYDDSNSNIFILLKNGYLYINDKKEYEDIDRIFQLSNVSIYAISKNKRIIPLVNKNGDLQKYISNENIPYKKILTSDLAIVALTKEGVVKFIADILELAIDYKNLSDVTDIDYIEETEEFIVNHDNSDKYNVLFIQ